MDKFTNLVFTNVPVIILGLLIIGTESDSAVLTIAIIAFALAIHNIALKLIYPKKAES